MKTDENSIFVVMVRYNNSLSVLKPTLTYVWLLVDFLYDTFHTLTHTQVHRTVSLTS